SGQCVIVGRGAPYFLRNRGDTLTVFLYAPRSLKVERVAAQVGNRPEAEHLVDSVDQDRAEFIRHYFGKEWPSRPLYHMMLNTIIGIDETVDVLVETIGKLGAKDQTRVDLD
ncbi:MAG: AAA family ATPase, partial [Limisphaerales bacterium]